MMSVPSLMKVVVKLNEGSSVLQQLAELRRAGRLQVFWPDQSTTTDRWSSVADR
jgi:hypothetical protein